MTTPTFQRRERQIMTNANSPDSKPMPPLNSKERADRDLAATRASLANATNKGQHADEDGFDSARRDGA
jgi:hypothetical protein